MLRLAERPCRDAGRRSGPSRCLSRVSALARECPLILILTASDDVHADAVQSLLQARGLPCRRVDTGLYPTRSRVSVSLDAKGGDHTELDLLPERLDLAEVTAIWHRAPSATRIPAEVLHAPLQAYVPRAAAHFLDDVFEPLRCLQVPARHSALRRAGYKIAQLRRASAHGFEIPPTLVSNDPQRILEFVREHEGRVISKTLDPLLSSQFLYPRYSRYTEAFSRRDTGYLSSARHAAAIFQAEVAKRIEIRVMVVDGQIFAAEIHSQVARRTRRDWRRYDPFSTPIRPHALPACEAERCRSLLAEFELRYGALDFILTPDGRYVFLEINTNGQYLWLEHATRLPISDAIARLLGRAESCHG